MVERNTDVAALAAGALAATLTMIVGPGPYSLVSCAVSISLATIVGAYIIGQPRSSAKRCAVAMVEALTLLPLVGWLTQDLPTYVTDPLLLVAWLLMTIAVFAIDRHLGGGEPPRRRSERQGDDETPASSGYDDKRLYEAARPIVHPVRTMIQMGIGVGILVALAAKFEAMLHGCPPPWAGTIWVDAICKPHTLSIVAAALAFSAGIELAYMLFTPGPDEAVHPVILGIASSVLIIVSKTDGNWHEQLLVPLLCASIALLFFIDRAFLKDARPAVSGATGG